MGNRHALHVREMPGTTTGAAIAVLVGMAVASVGVFSGDLRADDPPDRDSPGVVVRQEGLTALQADLAKRITSAPARAMKNYGLVGAMGGARVRVSSTKPQEILLPIPQFAD